MKYSIPWKEMRIEKKIFYVGPAFEVQAGTTGYKGGDAGYGSRAYMRCVNAGGSDIEYRVSEDGKELEIVAAGDCEIEMLINALRAAAETLNRQVLGKSEKGGCL